MKDLQMVPFRRRVSDLGRSPSGAKTEQCKEEGGDARSAREPPDDAAMRRFAALRVSDGTRNPRPPGPQAATRPWANQPAKPLGKRDSPDASCAGASPYPGRCRAIPAGFGPNSQPWGQEGGVRLRADHASRLTAHNRSKTLALMRRGVFICVVAAMLIAALAPPPSGEARQTGRVATSAACNSVRYEGRTYVLYRRAVGCRSARRKVRYVHRHKRLPGWRCGSGSNFETGGGCTRGRKLFGWHPLD
jgi:hypothetical protein